MASLEPNHRWIYLKLSQEDTNKKSEGSENAMGTPIQPSPPAKIVGEGEKDPAIFKLAKHATELVEQIPGGKAFKQLVNFGLVLTETALRHTNEEETLAEVLVDLMIDHPDFQEIKANNSNISKEVDNKSKLNLMHVNLECIQKHYNTLFNVDLTEEAWEAWVQMFKTELVQGYYHNLNPKSANKYFKMLYRTENVQGMVDGATFILETEVKYHLMMVTYHCFRGEMGALREQYQNFDEHLDNIHSKVGELGVTRPIPLAKTNSLKLTNSTMLNKLIIEENLSGLRAVQGYLSQQTLNTPSKDSQLEFYTSHGVCKALQVYDRARQPPTCCLTLPSLQFIKAWIYLS